MEGSYNKIDQMLCEITRLMENVENNMNTSQNINKKRSKDTKKHEVIHEEN